MRIDFIINAPSLEAVEELRLQVNKLRDEGNEVYPRLTFESGDAARFAREASGAGSALVIAAGGDGTINEVVNGLHDYLETHDGRGGAEGRPPVPRLGIIPLGTANDLAATLEIPPEIPAAVEIAVHGNALEVDIARVNHRSFLNVSTGGFGAEATEETPPEVKRTLGSLAYLITGVRKFVNLDVSPARFAAGELMYEGPFLLFAVGNSRQTGGGNLLTPLADLADGLLDVCIVKEMPRVEFLTLLPDLRAGKHLDHDAVIYRQVPELLVEADVPLSVNADGEPLRSCRLEYRISPHRLLLVVRPRPKPTAE